MKDYDRVSERIHSYSGAYEHIKCDRIEVPGGWIVRTFYRDSDRGVSVHQIFIADEFHSWRFKENQPGQ